MTRRLAPWIGLGLGLAGLLHFVEWVASHDWRGDPPRLEIWPPSPRSGDEPHYLVVVHSLLFDGDLVVGDDYAAAAAGGPEAGRVFRGRPLDHHSILWDPADGRTILWQSVFDRDRHTPCDAPGCVPFALRDPHGSPPDLSGVVELPSHPPGFPALLVAALWHARPDPELVDQEAARVVLAICLLTLVGTGALALRVGLGPGGTLAAMALLAVASTWLAYTKSFYAETAAGLLLTFGLLALCDGRIGWAALVGVGAMWLKPVMLLVGGGWILERWWAGERGAALRLALAFGVGGLAWLAFNQVALGRPIVLGATEFPLADDLEYLVGTWLHPHGGLLPFVPWVAVALFAPWQRQPDPHARRLVAGLAWPAALYWIVLSVHGAYAGSCIGPRYWIPFLPGFAVAAVLAARGAPRRLGWPLAILAVASAAMAVPTALQYAELFREPAHAGLVRMLSGAP